MVLVVGMNPSGWPGHWVGFPHRGALARLTRWMDAAGTRYFGFVNVLQDSGTFHQRNVDLEFLREVSSGFDRIIALGGFAARALRRAGIESFLMVPHPSGRNRVFNDPEVENRVIVEIAEYLK